MKYLRLVMPLALAAFVATWSIAAADSYDSETATIQKKTDKSVKVIVGKDTYTAPVKFADGADWSSVKDHYEINPTALEWIKAGKACITVGSDGSLSYSTCGKK